MHPMAPFPFDSEIAPEISDRWKRARVGRENAPVLVGHARATPRWPLGPAAVDLHSMHQMHRDSDEQILL